MGAFLVNSVSSISYPEAISGVKNTFSRFISAISGIFQSILSSGRSFLSTSSGLSLDRVSIMNYMEGGKTFILFHEKSIALGFLIVLAVCVVFKYFKPIKAIFSAVVSEKKQLLTSGSNVLDAKITSTINYGYLTFTMEKMPVQYTNSNLMFCIDISGSMAGNRINAVKNAIKGILTAIEPIVKNPNNKISIGIVTFNDAAKIVYSLQEINEEKIKGIRRKIDEIGCSGGTDILSGINCSLEIISKWNKKNRYHILLTDGEVDGKPIKHHELTKIHKTVKDAGIHFFAIGIGKNHARQMLENLATVKDSSYGQYVDASEEEKTIIDAINAIYSQSVQVNSIRLRAEPSHTKLKVPSRFCEKNSEKNSNVCHLINLPLEGICKIPIKIEFNSGSSVDLKNLKLALLYTNFSGRVEEIKLNWNASLQMNEGIFLEYKALEKEKRI